jgi:hypothetical protein
MHVGRQAEILGVFPVPPVAWRETVRHQAGAGGDDLNTFGSILPVYNF